MWAYSSLVIQLPALVEEHSNTWQIRVPLLRHVPNIPKLNDKEFRYSPKDMEPQILSLLFLAFQSDPKESQFFMSMIAKPKLTGGVALGPALTDFGHKHSLTVKKPFQVSQARHPKSVTTFENKNVGLGTHSH